MYKWLIVFLSLLTIIVSNYLIEACLSCSKHTYKPYSMRLKFLTRLSDSRKLNNLALTGTHLSFSYMTSLEEIKTQDLHIEHQLKYGIRVFDIAVRQKFNSFELYMSNIPLNIYLHHVLIPMYRFLYHYRREFLIVYINQDPDSMFKNLGYNNCEILDYLIESTYGKWYITRNWTLEDPIGNHRGKILLATSDDSFSGCAFNIKKNCLVQNDNMVYNLKKSPNFFHKWESISNLITDSGRHSLKCYVNDISFDDGIQTRRAIAKDGGYEYRSQCPRPINEVMAEKFTNPHRALVIILVDFATQNLIDTIYLSNFIAHHHV